MIVLETKTPKAKKRHKCDYCGEYIEVGEIYENQTNIGDGELYHWKSHISCAQLSDELRLFDKCGDDGVTSDNFDEYVCQEYYDLLDGNVENGNVCITFKDKLKAVKNYYKL